MKEQKDAEKQRRKEAAAKAAAEKLEQMKINPSDMFRNETDKYSAFDDKVKISSVKSIDIMSFLYGIFDSHLEGIKYQCALIH